MRLVVGISDDLPKLVVRSPIQPVIDEPHLRLSCHEGEIGDLLADLALHRLDLVLADPPAPPNPNVRVYSHSLGSSPVAWYCSPELAAAARRGFPHSLAKVQCSWRPGTLRCERRSTNGSSDWVFARAWSASSKTVRC